MNGEIQILIVKGLQAERQAEAAANRLAAGGRDRRLWERIFRRLDRRQPLIGARPAAGARGL